MRGAANWYKCYSCGFTCSRLNVIIWHNKAHIKKVYNYDTGIKIPGRRKRKQGTPKSNKDIKKKAREAKSKENMQHAHTNGEVISSKKDVEDTQQLLKDWDDDDEGIDGETFTSLPRSLDKEKKRSDSDDGYSDTDDYPPLQPKYERRPMPKATELNSVFDALLAATPANPITPSSSQTSNYVNNDSDSDYSDWDKYYARDSGSGSEDEEVEQESDIKSLCEGKEGKAEANNDTNSHMKQEEKDDDEGHSVQEDCLYEARQEDCLENTPSPKIDLVENVNSDSLGEIDREELTSEPKEDGEEVSFQNAYYEPDENVVETVDIVESVGNVDEPSETISEPAEDTDKPAEESNELAKDIEKTTEDIGEPVEDDYEAAELIGEHTEPIGEPPELIGEPPELIGEPHEPIGEPPEPSDEHGKVSDKSAEDIGEHSDFIDNPTKDFEESDDCTDDIEHHLQEPEDISESSSHFDKPNVEMNESARDIDELTQNIDRLNQNISEFTQSVSAKLGEDEEETKNIHETAKGRGSTHELTDRTFETTSTISLPSHSKAESASEDGCESLKTSDAAATSSSGMTYMLVAVDAHGNTVPTVPTPAISEGGNDLVAVEAAMEDGTTRTLYIDPSQLGPNVDLNNLMLHIDSSGQEHVIIPSSSSSDSETPCQELHLTETSGIHQNVIETSDVQPPYPTGSHGYHQIDFEETAHSDHYTSTQPDESESL
ncbi:uncharacterized protein [Panulirus ornatus]|uniref:uncharacterized protein n=1 Tax=Panulirus ornatus TaxID=150431 RepID=UPI003A840DC5